KRTFAHRMERRDCYQPSQIRGRLGSYCECKNGSSYSRSRKSWIYSRPSLGAATRVQPDSEPGACWAIVGNDRVTESIGKWALATGVGETGKGVAAIGGNRCARDADRADIAAP